ncbi:MAG: DUF222 domain-containing protein [Streptosporangiaceae bacterium]|jgi:hypothetical protein
MTDGSFHGCGQDGEEPEGSSPFPAGGNGPHDAGPGSGDDRDGPGEDGFGEWLPPEGGAGEQGLFWCVPAGAPDLAGFAGEAGVPAIAPGPLLAGLASVVAGGDGDGLAGASEDFLFAVMSAGRRMVSWGTWLELSAMRELALRHPATPGRPARRSRPGTGTTGSADAEPAGLGSAGAEAADGKPAAGKPDADGRVQLSEFAADEVAAGLRLTWTAAADRILYACDLAGRLPATFAALGAGLIDPVHARIIFEQTDYLSVADAAKADAVLAAAAQHKTYGELRAAAVKLALKLDPESAERRKQTRRKNDAHVRPFREESGNAGMTARELPSDEVLASWQHVEQRAQDLQAAGVPGSLRELRWRAYLDLLQERDSRDTLPSPQGGQDGNVGPGDGPGGNGGPGDGPGGNGGHGGPGYDLARQPRAGSPGPSLAALVNLTVPLATAFGESGTPGEAAGFGILDAGTARDLIAAAGRDPRTRWCVTVLHPDGTAAAHGCAAGQHQPPGPAPPRPDPPGPEPHSPPGAANLGAAGDTRGGPDQRPPPGTRAQDYLRSLRVTLAPIARGTCDHRHAEAGYQPSRKLRHLIRARSTRCSAPGCGRPAARCDLDHTLAWDAGGITCECDLAPLCRHHHRCKQAEGWHLAQPEPGVLQWRTPNGHTHTTTPAEYAI